MNNRKTDKHLAKKSGFTLIEVILVVVIISIISGIALKGLDPGGKREMANITDANATISILSGAVQQFEVINSEYPNSLEELIDESKGGPFLMKKSIPKDPWGQPYSYSAPGAHNTHSFDISCTAKDGTVINNWE